MKKVKKKSAKKIIKCGDGKVMSEVFKGKILIVAGVILIILIVLGMPYFNSGGNNLKAGICVKEGAEYSLRLSPGGSVAQCCGGLRFTSQRVSSGGVCSVVSDMGVCINCGDGICGLGENACNCERDC